MKALYAPVGTFRDLADAHVPLPGEHVLGSVAFRAECADPTVADGFVSATVALTGPHGEGFAEVWTTPHPVTACRDGELSYAEDGELLFGACRIPPRDDYIDATEQAYEAALALIDERGYRELFRIWHYIGELNANGGSGLEVYREFCLGRARALERHGLTASMPAATAIGTPAGGIVFYFLSARSGIPVHIDNPRQVPPYFYPNRYGPKAPNFARATHLAGADGVRTYVSGTAGILGHRTMHTGDVDAQCRLALANVEYVIGAANLSVHDVEAAHTMRDLRQVKVYVRYAEDVPLVAARCREVLPPEADVRYLRADICRADLLVELEGIAVEGERVCRTPRPAHTASAAKPEWTSLPAAQQPQWRDHPAFKRVQDRLAAAPALVHPEELRALRAELADVATGSARLLQIGDYAESFYEATGEHTASKIAELGRLADRLGTRTGQKVVQVGRMAGQYAKPRSQATETVDGVGLPAFRGHLVNSDAASEAARRHDPLRMLWAYEFSAATQQALRAHRAATPSAHPGPWASHDALVLDYLLQLVRMEPGSDERFLGSTHFPWVGERTAGVDHAHVRLLAGVSNPVAVKVGPRCTPAGVVRWCEVLDPRREPGRLTLIARLGRHDVAALLPPIVRAVRDAGHPVVWVSDPMHGNTVKLPSGRKVRYLDDVVAEALAFRDVLTGQGVHVGGLHLETAAYPVGECLPLRGGEAEAGEFSSLCDPRLSPEQAADLIDRVF